MAPKPKLKIVGDKEPPLPCPFCGESGEFDPDVSAVVCDGCTAHGPVVGVGCDLDEDDEEGIETSAIHFWNKREVPRAGT